MAAKGLFREDLLFRLQGVGIELPPLAGHPEDILDFAAHFTKESAERLGIAAKPLSEDFARALLAYSWPGNVRELKNTVEGALALAAADELLLPVHLPLHIRVCAARNRVTGRSGGRDEAVPEHLSPVADLPDFREYRDSREADYLRALVERHGGDIGHMNRKKSWSS